MTHSEAVEEMDKYGFFGGDDSLVGGMTIEAYSKAAKYTGHVVTGEVVKRGDRGVNFLARYYHRDVWYGNPNSCTDIARAASKFMTAAHLPESLPPVCKLLEKCDSVMMTDANTPIIGEVARAATSLDAKRLRKTARSEGDASYWASFDANEQYPNDNSDGWMDDELAIQLPTFDYAAFKAAVDACTAPEQLLALPFCETELIPLRAGTSVITSEGRGTEDEPLGPTEIESQVVGSYIPGVGNPADESIWGARADGPSFTEPYGGLEALHTLMVCPGFVAQRRGGGESAPAAPSGAPHNAGGKARKPPGGRGSGKAGARRQ